MPDTPEQIGDLSPSGQAGRFCINLIEPGDSLNVGAVARAMMNLGFTQLCLTAPRDYQPERAAATACWAGEILKTARICPDIDQSLADFEDVVGFTARSGRHRPPTLLLSEWIAEIPPNSPRRTALLFGPEEAGLATEHIRRCRQLVRIPSTRANPSFNLSQAVLLVLYELAGRCGSTPAAPPPREFPTWEQYARLDALLLEAGEASGFYNAHTPSELPDLVRNLFRRLQPNQREFNILLGYLSAAAQRLADRSLAEKVLKS